MENSRAGGGRTPTIGAVVFRDETYGVVVDAWPLTDPRELKVRWEPLRLGRVEVCASKTVQVIEL